MSNTPSVTGAPPRRILIVGGGTAGWMTAAYLARTLNAKNPDAVRITLIESPDIGIIGVGEGTFPTIRTTLQILGIDEAEFLRESTATYKQGIKFVDWEHAPVQGADGKWSHSHYIHPFDTPYPAEGNGLMPYWLLKDKATRPPFAEAVTFQIKAADSHKAPKRNYDKGFTGPLNYAYHFDAASFARLLCKRGVELGVTHLQGTIGEVALDDTGAIASVSSPEHGTLTADLYVDCTGFAAKLIGQALGEPLKSVKQHLFADRAVTCQVPYDDPKGPIASYTVSTGHEAGWTWDIGLNSRRGIGYVYSSDHSSDDRAEEVLRAYVKDRGNADKAEIKTRRIAFQGGYRERQWVKNCVAVGLSASFFEPLESTGIVLIEIAAGYISDFFQASGPVDLPSVQFNSRMSQRCRRIVDFIKLHYCLTKRPEPFWRDNADPKSMSAELNYHLAMWKYRPPSRHDFIEALESFAYSSYQFILYGMGFETDYGPARSSFPRTAETQIIFDRVADFARQAAADLPDHRALIEEVYAHGYRDKASKDGLISAPRRA